MRHSIDRIKSNIYDYKMCKECGMINWYENEECIYCGSNNFNDIGDGIEDFIKEENVDIREV